jgi:putative aldouronate transport system permease protein
MNNKLLDIKKFKQIRNNWLLYALLLPVLAWYLIFCYAPMDGIILAFKNYQFNLGLYHSPWVGLDNFTRMFQDRNFALVVKNTIIFSLGRIAFQMPCAILLAILLNELTHPRAKRLFQTVVTVPHFISWVVLAGILINIFNSSGIVNQIFAQLGLPAVAPLVHTGSFRAFIWISNIWKEVGWDSIIYLAAITTIDPGLYESASIDGANRFQKMRLITFPGIRSTVYIMLILAVGQIMTNGGFDQIFNLYSPQVYSVADTLDTYIFRESFITGGLNYGYSTAIGLFKSVIGVVLITISNKIVKSAGENGLF